MATTGLRSFINIGNHIQDTIDTASCHLQQSTASSSPAIYPCHLPHRTVQTNMDVQQSKSDKVHLCINCQALDRCTQP